MFDKQAIFADSSQGRRVGFGLLAVGLAMGVHAAVHTVLPKQFPFLPFAAAVLVACRWSGAVGGLFATIASTFVLRYWILPPPLSFVDERSLGLVLFVAAGLCVTWQTATIERQARRVYADETKENEAQETAAELPPFEVVGR